MSIIGLSTLKKEYSISCKEYVHLGFLNGKLVVECDGTILGEFEIDTEESVKRANELFYYYVNKI